MGKVCRTCLCVINREGEVFKLDAQDVQKLQCCVPELVSERVVDPVLCGVCFNLLNLSYNFKVQCRNTEEKLYNLVTRLQTHSVDLNIYYIELRPEQNTDVTQEATSMPSGSMVQCKVCYKSFVSNELLREHSMIHFQPIFKCTKCDFQTHIHQQVNEHIQLHAKDLPAPALALYQNVVVPTNAITYQCTGCAFNTQQLDVFKQHRATHENERLYRCSICSFSSTHQSSIKRHSKVHEKPFKCSECRYQTLDKADLTAHMNLHIGQQFNCNYCPYFSLKRANLRRHKVRNHPDKPKGNNEGSDDEPENSDPYKVSINDIESILNEDESHVPPTEMTTAEPVEDDSFAVTVDDIQQILQNGRDPASPSEDFKCPTCSETFKYKYLLRKHVSIHSTDKLFECPECGLRTKTRVHLQGHMKTHGGVVTYTCEQCTFTSIYWGIMQKHKMVHTGEKPFKCPMCDYRGTYQSTIKYHMSSAHNKPYACTECPFATDSESDMFEHMEVHASQRIDEHDPNRIHDSEILYNYISQIN